ncbi:MAG: YhcH/YjgK/YiaL family protein [Alphaproteobacteria bacterium]|nr:YhcH/YjgK/YiaL family protein [Alphaproteobacteria bacterium]
MKSLAEQGLIPSDMVELVERLMDKFEPKRYDFDGGRFANAECYNTKLQSRFEAHRKMVDIQIVVSGTELINFAYINDNFVVEEPYDEMRDIMFMKGEVKDTVLLRAGDACIIGPELAHMPGMAVNGSSHVKKIVLKIPVEEFYKNRS